jgi:hypothetical protein
MNARREPQAPLDPPASWWGEDNELEDVEYPPEDPSMPLQCLAIKLKHTIIPEGVIAIDGDEGKWKIQMSESSFRKAFEIYAIEPFTSSYSGSLSGLRPVKYKLINQVVGVTFYCLTEIDEAAQ